MANVLNCLYCGIVLTLSAISFIALFYKYYWSGVISLILVLSLFIILFWVYFFKCFVPILLKTLITIRKSLTPLVNYLNNNTKVIGPVISWCIRATFFFWFFALLISDVF